MKPYWPGWFVLIVANILTIPARHFADSWLWYVWIVPALSAAIIAGMMFERYGK